MVAIAGGGSDLARRPPWRIVIALTSRSCAGRLVDWTVRYVCASAPAAATLRTRDVNPAVKADRSVTDRRLQHEAVGLEPPLLALQALQRSFHYLATYLPELVARRC